MTTDQYLAALREVGWFEKLPQAARSDAEANIRRSMEAGESPEPWGEAIWFDCESVHEQGDYSSLLRLFAKGSYGVFIPEDISETWDVEDGHRVVTLSFTSGGERFEGTLRGDEDWVSPDFFDLLDDAMDSCAGGLAFGDIDTGDQTALFFLCNGEAFDRAEEAGLLPSYEAEGE